MTAPKGPQPRWVVLHGDDEFGRSETLARLRARLASGDPAMDDLNTTVLDGSRVTMGELRHACDAIPFLSAARVIIVNNLLARLGSGRRQGEETAPDVDPAWKKTFREELKAYLPKLPATTRLFFVESETLPASHPILQLAYKPEEENKVFVRAFDVPKDRELPGWVRQHARAQGGDITPEAAELLAALVGRDLRLLDTEIDKLLLYANGERPVQAGDVRRLVSRAREESIFELVDCVGRRQTDRALQLLHHMLEDEGEPLQILGMIGRQVRILIEVAELGGRGLVSSEIAAQLKLHPYVTSKAVEQARNFQMSQLEAAHERLVETDWAIKTGKLEPELALDLLVVRLGSVAS